jgi:phosphomannomutase
MSQAERAEDKGSLIVSVSGIRGIFGAGLTPRVAETYAATLGTFLQGGRVVVSRDSRPSGRELRTAVLAGLTGTGCDVFDLEIVPTPTVGLAIRQLRATGGVQITASHNPAPYNGLKLFGAQGTVLSAALGKQVQLIFGSRQVSKVPPAKSGKVSGGIPALDWHRDRVLALVDVPAIRAARLRTFLDANGGAGGPLGVNLLEAFGCQVEGQACEPDGVFVHPPEPTADHLHDVCPLVAERGADIGFVLDPDADRLALIDEQGRYIGEELTLALAVRFRLA